METWVPTSQGRGLWPTMPPGSRSDITVYWLTSGHMHDPLVSTVAFGHRLQGSSPRGDSTWPRMTFLSPGAIG